MRKNNDGENETSSKSEFRKNYGKGKGHPAYIYAKIGNDYKYLGLTHSDITKGVKNIKLDKNPNPLDKRSAYVRPKAEKEKTRNFGKKLKGWKFTKEDKQKINKCKNSHKKRTT